MGGKETFYVFCSLYNLPHLGRVFYTLNYCTIHTTTTTSRYKIQRHGQKIYVIEKSLNVDI